MPDYDVAIVGGSIAGCTAATLLARQGLRVAVLEKSPDPAHHKVPCTHEIVPMARPALEDLGILDTLLKLGREHHIRVWTRYGWALNDGQLPAGINIRRETLDPIVRETAASSDGVDMMLGMKVTEVLHSADGRRPIGLHAQDKTGRQQAIHARVLVGADGKGSDLARLTGLPARVREHGRIGFGGYFDGVKSRAGGDAQMWMMDPDVAYTFPTDAGLTAIVVAVKRTPERLAAFRSDPMGTVRSIFEGLPDAPEVDWDRQVGKIIGIVDSPNLLRPAAGPAVALVGDAAQTTDYVFGTGCGFAFAGARWLAQAIGPELASGKPDHAIDKALNAYHRRHRKELAMHHLMISDYASGRTFSPVEKILFHGAAVDPKVGQAFYRVASRAVPPQRALTPPVLVRAAVASLRDSLSRA